jgi:eukaryotic-like serine/threonine-protein kinase
MFEGTRELWGREGALIASRYKLERRIGAGAMGVVWSAYDCHTKGPVAIKLLNLPDSAHKQRFRHECQMLASLSHANIVQVLAINAEDDSELASIIMELLQCVFLQKVYFLAFAMHMLRGWCIEI